MKTNPDNIQILTELGLNNLEAEVYLYLLVNKPHTAYGIGKILGKPTANVYKAIEALSRKGAVMVEGGKNRLCRAVPATEFLRHIKNQFNIKTKKASVSLSRFKKDIFDEGVYQLHSSPLVITRARTMLGKCKNIAIIDVFPEPLKQIRPALEKAIKRGIEIYLQVYEPVDIPGAIISCATEGNEVLKHWDSQQLNVIIDGKEHLLSLMNQDLSRVYQAIWSQSLYLSCALHGSFMQHHTVIRLLAERHKPDALSKIQRILDETRFFHNSDIPGQKALLERYLIRDRK